MFHIFLTNCTRRFKLSLYAKARKYINLGKVKSRTKWEAGDRPFNVESRFKPVIP